MTVEFYKRLRLALIYFGVIVLLVLANSLTGNAQSPKFENQLSKTHNYKDKINLYIDLGRKTGQVDFDNVIELSQQGIALAKEKQDLSSIGILERHIGNSNYFQGKYDMAAKAFYQSLENLERLPKSVELAETYNSTAKLFRKTRDLTKSANFYEKAIDVFTILKDSAGLATIYNEYGVVYEYKGEMITAEKYYNASLNINKALKNPEGICYALNNLSGLFTLQGKYQKAEFYLGQTLALRKILNDSLALALTYSDLGQNYILAEKFRDAKKYFDSSIYISRKLKYAELLADGLLGSATALEGLGEWQDAVGDYKANRLIEDSIFNLKKTEQVQEINAKYETGKKQNKILKQQLELKQRNIYLFALVCLILLLSIFAQKKYRDFKQKKESEQAIQDVIARKEKADAVLSAEDKERHRIASDLHDGVGQIMSAVKMNISAFGEKLNMINIKEKQQFNDVIGMVDMACVEVRNVSHKMMPLDSFNNRLDQALESLVKQIDHNKIKIGLYIEGFSDDEPGSTKNILYRVIQELINNVIKHSKASSLDINVVRDTEGITASIEDDGVGFDNASPNMNSGVGLKNIQSRLDFINGTMEVNTQPGKGTCIIVYIAR